MYRVLYQKASVCILSISEWTLCARLLLNERRGEQVGNARLCSLHFQTNNNTAVTWHLLAEAECLALLHVCVGGRYFSHPKGELCVIAVQLK